MATNMNNSSKGIHHISIISGDGQRNANFYVKTLGLRMVMKTVNQDDPSRYHLFYANGTGQPGSSITFFPWPIAHQGKSGSGEATEVAFAVPSGSAEYWAERLGENDINFGGPYEQFGYKVIAFEDPDRLLLKLVFDPDIEGVKAYRQGSVPHEFGIRGFWGTTLQLVNTEGTSKILEDVFGFEKKETEKNATLYQTGSSVGNSVILEEVDSKQGKPGRGIIHHVAFRAKDKKEQLTMRQKVVNYGLNPTEVINRRFFYSVYFRSPGGVLFEIATDGPGYKSVQPEEKMGKELYLPGHLDSRREMIEKRLPEIAI